MRGCTIARGSSVFWKPNEAEYGVLHKRNRIQPAARLLAWLRGGVAL
jgi:hypothetical protein